MSTQGHFVRPHLREWSGDAVTGANGQAVFTFPAGLFTGLAPIVISSVLMGTMDSLTYFTRIVSVSTSGCVVEVKRSANDHRDGILGLGAFDFLAASTVVSGITVEIHARQRGST